MRLTSVLAFLALLLGPLVVAVSLPTVVRQLPTLEEAVSPVAVPTVAAPSIAAAPAPVAAAAATPVPVASVAPISVAPAVVPDDDEQPAAAASPSASGTPPSATPTPSASPSVGSPASPTPSPGIAIAPVGPAEIGTIWGILTSGGAELDEDNTDYDMFSRAVAAVNYDGVLTSAHGGKGVTCLLPPDAAFVQTARDLGYGSTDEAGAFLAIERVLSNITNGQPLSALFDIVGYHILPGAYNQDLLIRYTPLSTYQGSSIVVEGTRLRHVSNNLADPNLVGGSSANRIADNGIMHGIDRLLFPFEINVDIARQVINALQPADLAGTTMTTNSTGGTEAGISDGGSVCFPAAALVQTADGHMQIGSLRAGQRVRISADDTMSAVFAFTHRELDGVYEFIHIELEGSPHSITLSAEHYMYANEIPVRAADVHVGDVVRTVAGLKLVRQVSQVFDRGLVAPHTMHGDIVVGGIVASTYTSLLSVNVAHALLSPIRAIVRAGVSNEPLGAVFYYGKAHTSKVSAIVHCLRYLSQDVGRLLT